MRWVVAVEMTVALDHASTASGVLEVCGPSECGRCGIGQRGELGDLPGPADGREEAGVAAPGAHSRIEDGNAAMTRVPMIAPGWPARWPDASRSPWSGGEWLLPYYIARLARDGRATQRSAPSCSCPRARSNGTCERCIPSSGIGSRRGLGAALAGSGRTASRLRGPGRPAIPCQWQRRSFGKRLQIIPNGSWFHGPHTIGLTIMDEMGAAWPLIAFILTGPRATGEC
jgi:hypothetical protein